MKPTQTTKIERQQLVAKRRHVTQQIAAYPMPIPACDEQFNWLLEQRDEIGRRLQQLKELECRNR